MNITAVIPAFNEEATIAPVISELRSARCGLEELEIIVVDNGSTDQTAAAAEAAGARVVFEPERGYGAACLCGIAAAQHADVVVFVDADGSDVSSEWPQLVEPLLVDGVDLTIGTRIHKEMLPGVLPLHQCWGNRFAAWVLNRIYGADFTDLGPFRAIRTEALSGLELRDRDFGWTLEMQIRALQLGLRVREVPVSYRRRAGGRSKISGTLRGSWRAGVKILSILLREIVRGRGWR